MTRAPGLTSINCTQCGAGLDVLGGGRVVTHVCPYCGSELDAQHDYAVLRRFADMPRPESPFRLGMTGQVWGVDWTVIGTLGMRETWAGKTWEWAEHQLFSPTHGYAVLTVENGHLTLSRRQRRATRPTWMGVHWVETADNRPTVRLGQDRYTYYETSTARVTFAEGEFTWAPQMGDETVTVSALSGDAMLDFSQTGDEREIWRNTWLDRAQTLASFGIADAPAPRGVHPLQPFRAGRHSGFLTWASGGFAMLCLLVVIVLATLPGRPVIATPQHFALDALPQELRFDVSDTERLVSLSFEADVYNSWAWLGIELLDPEGETLFETGREMDYYTGTDSDGRWSEGSPRSRLRFRPTEPGSYTLILTEAEGGTWNAGRTASRVSVTGSEGISSGMVPGLLALAFALLAGWQVARSAWHRHRRWAGSDWSDD